MPEPLAVWKRFSEGETRWWQTEKRGKRKRGRDVPLIYMENDVRQIKVVVSQVDSRNMVPVVLATGLHVMLLPM